MLERKFNNFSYLFLYLLIPSNLIPEYLRHFNNEFFDLRRSIFLEHLFQFGRIERLSPKNK